MSFYVVSKWRSKRQLREIDDVGNTHSLGAVPLPILVMEGALNPMERKE